MEDKMIPSEARDVLLRQMVSSAHYIQSHKEFNQALSVAIAALDAKIELDAIFDQPKGEDDVTVDDYLKSVCTGQHVEYHYLPEVPQDGEWVIVYGSYNYTHGRNALYNSDELGGIGIFCNSDGDAVADIYAWTRIPPKPPVKPTEK